MMLLPMIAGLFLMLVSAPAHAGFEWTPASSAATRAQTTEPLMPAMPPVEVQVIDPTMIVSPAIGMAAPPALSSAPEIPASGMQGQAFAEAIGFGEDMPLVLALRQVVPPRYAFAFDPSVDQAARVNWNGGKPWNMVLDDTLKPLGLSAQITESTVRVIPATAMSSAPLAAQVPAAVPVAPQAAASAPMLVVPPDETGHAPDKVREVYIRRNGQTSQMEDAPPAVDETLSPAAGGPAIEEEKTSLWHRMGFGGEKNETAASEGRPAMPAPLLTAPEGNDYKEAIMQPVSLSSETERPPAAMLKTAKRQGVMDPYDVRFWQAEKGDSLKNVLATWSETAGVELYWISTEDYVLPEAVRLHGNYTEALTHVLGAYGDGVNRPQGRLHPNLPTGPSVLIIEAAQK